MGLVLTKGGISENCEAWKFRMFAPEIVPVPLKPSAGLFQAAEARLLT